MDRQKAIKRFEIVLKISGFAPGTKKIYLMWLNRFFDFIDFEKQTGLTHYQGQDYLNYLIEEKNYAARTHNQAVYALRLFYKSVLAFTDADNAFPKLPARRPEKGWFTGEQVREMIKECKDTKLKTAIALSFVCGLRVDEIAKLQMKHFNSKSKYILIENSKGNKTRTVRYTESLAKLLTIYCKEYGINTKNPEAFIFPNEKKPGEKINTRKIAQTFVDYAQTFDFFQPNHTFHSLRHAFATELAMKKVPLPHIQKLMGHTTIATTATYIHSPESELGTLPDVLNYERKK